VEPFERRSIFLDQRLQCAACRTSLTIKTRTTVLVLGGAVGPTIGTYISSDDGDDAAPAFSEALSELIQAIDVVIDARELDRFLNQINPIGKDLGSARTDGVRFMSMASSKGLTVRATIVAAVEEGLIPRPSVPRAEERRLLYVAMTRSREYLYCTWARTRRGPTARAGRPNVGERRQISPFLRRSLVASSDGRQFINRRWPAR